MKVSLVVAAGNQQGRVIPITGSQFLIGRDAQCQLRPASQAISKKHCGVIIRDGKVYIADFGSTNGTLVNDELVKGAEVAVEDGASVKIGPLDFTLRVEQVELPADGTPLPSANPDTSAIAAAKATPKPANRDSTPNPAKPLKPAAAGAKENATQSGSKEAPALKANAPAKPVEPAKPAPKPVPAATGGEDHDDIAAMLLGMDDEEGGEVPDGSTVMEMPASIAPNEPGAPAAAAKPDDKKKAQSREDMTNAANDILRKMMRRPK